MCKTTDLSIIILNYNGQYWLERALRSIEKNYLPFTIYRVSVTVVDNASTDHSVDFLKTIDWVRLIEADHNGGYAYGNNLALRENTSKYVLLLNNDTEFTKYTSNLDLLVEYMDKHPQTGIITPRVELANGHIDKACHRGEPKPWIALSYLTGLEKNFPKSRFFGSLSSRVQEHGQTTYR
jgi:Predicted glycosyltransferases